MMLDKDLAQYDFMFELTRAESLDISQNVTSLENLKHSKRVLAFTEHGILMLSSVLKSKLARQINIRIMRTFVELRKLVASNTALEEKLRRIESRLDLHDQKHKEVYAFIQFSINDNETKLI